MAVFPAREGQAEMIKPMIERHAGDTDREIAHIGEIGQPQPARRMLLPKDNLTWPIGQPVLEVLQRN